MQGKHVAFHLWLASSLSVPYALEMYAEDSKEERAQYVECSVSKGRESRWRRGQMWCVQAGR